MPGVVLNVGDEVAVMLTLKVAPVETSVSVIAEPSLINTSPAVSTVIDRQFVENLPMNGRTFQSLIALSPGTVITNASGNDNGQFSVNGQRADANNFMVDGVSANIGVGFGSLNQGGGSLPGLSSSGGTNNLVSIDALEEFKIETSSFAPEFGRMPGAQVSIVARSGTNTFRGTGSEYFRNEALDANDWFASRNGTAKPKERQNDFGGVLGGPIFRDRLFFFGSYEGLRLQQPNVITNEVPTVAARQAAPAAVRPLLDAFPMPNGAATTAGFARLNASFSNPSSLDAASVRLDRTIPGKGILFARYNYAPSDSSPRLASVSSSSALSNSRISAVLTQTLTSGVTMALSPRISNDLRINWSRQEISTIFVLDNFGGAVPPPDSAIFPMFATHDSGSFSLSLNSGRTTVRDGTNAVNVRRQVNMDRGMGAGAQPAVLR